MKSLISSLALSNVFKGAVRGTEYALHFFMLMKHVPLSPATVLLPHCLNPVQNPGKRTTKS